jgi:acetate kinase
LFTAADPPVRLLGGRVERIGMPGSRLVVADADHGPEVEASVEAPDPQSAIRLVAQSLKERAGLADIAAVGHRVVHGGNRFHRPERITIDVLDEFRRIAPYDPDHLPGEIEAIDAIHRLDQELPQVACFDTAFHHDLPRVAQLIATPRRYHALGIRRYGFHGLSYEFLMQELARVAGASEARGRVVLAHLGAGPSLAAVRDGRPIDTTMGFTSTSGLVMGTRCGDLDPGLVRFLTSSGRMTVDQFHDLVNRESGLLGVSETSADLRDLLARQNSDIRAAEAVALFCYRVATGIGAMAAALGGLDTLVFAAGIGENSAEVRRHICEGLGFLGLTLDPERNGAGAPLISRSDGRVAVRVIHTDEELMIARAVCALLPNRHSTPTRA